MLAHRRRLERARKRSQLYVTLGVGAKSSGHEFQRGHKKELISPAIPC